MLDYTGTYKFYSNPLFGMNEKDKKQFMKWLTPNDRKSLKRADRYWKSLAGKYII